MIKINLLLLTIPYIVILTCCDLTMRLDAPDIRRMDPQELALNAVFSRNFSANAEATAELGTGLTAYLSAWPYIDNADYRDRLIIL